MKNRNITRQVQKLNQKTFRPQSSHLINGRPNPKKGVRKFGDDLTNIYMVQQSIDQKKTQKNVSMVQIKGSKIRTQVQDYLSDIQQHLLQQDVNFYTQLTNSMELAPNIRITSDMRKVLIKWLKQVSLRFGFLQQTLHLACQLIDILLVERGLSFDKSNFQLLGIGSLFIACKYNQIHIPNSQRFLYVCDGLYSLENLLQMQALILIVINFNLQLPTIFNFLQTEMNAYKVSNKTRKFIKDLVSWCLLDFNLMNNYKKSQIVIFLIHFADRILNTGMYYNEQDSNVNKKSLQSGMLLLKKVYQLYQKQKNFNNQ